MGNNISLGQHWLKNRVILDEIAALAGGGGLCVEIGPGLGTLTSSLLKRFDMVVAVEYDERLADNLPKSFPGKNLEVVKADFLQFDLESIKESYAVAGNIPYYITSPIIEKILKTQNLPQKVVLLIQKEVAERLAEPPGSRTYGILSVLLQAYYDIEYLFTVDENVFAPPPKVKSAVIRLKRNSRKSLDCDEKLFFTVVKTAFNQRRKQLRNSLKPLLPKKDDEAEPKILDYRPEQLGVEDFVELTNYVARRQADNPPDT